jgi:hypothetical protein
MSAADAIGEGRRFCYYIPADSFVEGHGYRVSIVVEDEAGHSPTGTWPYHGRVGETMPWFWGGTSASGKSYGQAKEAAAAQNARLGLTPRAAADIVSSSIAAEIKTARGRRRNNR